MKPINRKLFVSFIVAVISGLVIVPVVPSVSVKDGVGFHLVDQTGERWDITQAVSIGFSPGGFEFGIGRHAFRPLTESDWVDDMERNHPDMRVIGVADGEESQAYSVRKLAYHETANTTLASRPIVVGY